MSNFILPIIVLVIVGYGVLKKIDVYDTFIEGAKESIDMILNMFPSILAMVFAVNIFLKSGILDFFKNSEIISIMLMRPISSNASLGILNELFKTHGVDSFLGFLGSIIQGSTDTTFYILTLYYGSIKIKNMGYSLRVGLLADLIGIISAIFLAKIFF